MRRWVLAAWLLVGCTDESAPRHDDASASAAVDGTQLVALEPRVAPSVEVQDAGAEPRRRFVVTPEPGTTEPMTVTLDSTTRLRTGGQALPEIVSPTLSLRGRLEIDAVADDAIVARHLVDEVTIASDSKAPDLLVQQLSAAKPAFESYRATLTLDPRGGLREGTVEVETAGNDAVAQLLHQLTDAVVQARVPLPETAIGQGARWTAVSRIEQGELAVRQRVTYELTKIEGNHLHLSISVEQSLLDTHVAVPGMPGTKAKVELFRSRGQGAATLDTTHVLPSESHLQLSVKMVMDVGGGPQELELTLRASIGRSAD